MTTKNSLHNKAKINIIENIIRLSSAGLLLVIVLLYVLFPALSFSVNRLMEMTLSGSEKALMMIYYQAGDLAWAMAGLNHCIQLLSVVMDKEAVYDGIYGLFTPISAEGIWVISGLTAVWILYGLGSVVRGLLLKNSVFAASWNNAMGGLETEKMLGKFKVSWAYELMASVLVLYFAAMGQGLLILGFMVFGFLGLDYKKVLLFSFFGFLLN